MPYVWAGTSSASAAFGTAVGRNATAGSHVLAAMPLDPDATATVITSRAIRAGHEQDFERWVERLNDLASAAPGYRAAIRLGQTAGFQHLLFRFDDVAAAEAWQHSDAVMAHAAVADGFSTALRQIESGNRVVFEVPSDASASKWKRFVTTWLAVFPVLRLVSTVVRMVLIDVPLPFQLVPSSLILTATLQWIILPRLQRYTRFWLLQDGSGRLQTSPAE